MFWDFPVPIFFYVAAAPFLALPLLPKLFDSVIKSKGVWIGGAIVAVGGMLLLQSENHLLGDGLQRLSDPGRTFMWTEPLDILAHRLVYLLVGSSLLSYRLVSFVAGLFYLNGVRLIARLGETPLEKSILALSFLATATMQFYFGYVEGYGLLDLFLLYYIYFSWKSIREGRASAAPLLFFLLATASHLSGAALLPSLVYVYKGRFPRLTKSAVPVLIVMVALAFFFARVWTRFVVFAANDYSDYSLLCGDHLKDLAGILILVTPAFFLALWPRRWNTTMTFTLLALIGTASFTILIDPVLGALRDWDLLSIFALPLCGMIALRAPRHRLTAGILAAIIVIRIVPWFWFNSEPQPEYMRSTVINDPHYQQEFAKGERLGSWGILLYRSGDLPGAREAFLKRLDFDPDHLNTLSMLAPLEFKMGNFKEAHEVYSKLLKLRPDSPEHFYKLCYTTFRLGDNETALRLLADSPPEFRNNPTSIRLYAGVRGAMGFHQEAVDIIERTPQEDAEGYLPYVLAKSCLEVGKRELARQLISRAVALDSADQDYRELQQAISSK